MGIPISMAVPPAFRDPLPGACDVVVIGGGIAGVMTAWFLRAKGLSVVLCEKGRIAGEQSGRNWGWIRQQGRDGAELPIVTEALRHWSHLSQTVGEGLGFRQTGVTDLANTPKDMAGFEAWLAVAQGQGLDTRMLTATEVAERFGSHRWRGGIETASDGRAGRAVARRAADRPGAGREGGRDPRGL